MKSVAFLSDCNKRRPMLVLVVAKKTREGLRILSALALREGIAIAGAKAQSFHPIRRHG
jgi:hypothetical protein